MYTYLITYDLGGPETEQSYNKIISMIKAVFPVWARPQKSVWIVKSYRPIAEVRDGIVPFVDNNDKLLVIDITKDTWATYNQSSEINTWLKTNI